MNSSVRFLQSKIIQIGLFSVIFLLIFYILSCNFRIFLKSQNIDPNFIIGFFTIIALLLSIIQGSNDKRYAYNSKLIDSIEDKGLRIIGKLLGIKSKGNVVLSSAEHCIKAKKANLVFKDLNNSLSKNDVENEMELITAYVDTYYPEHSTDWNLLLDKLTEVSNIAGNILINYQENIEFVNNPDFNNSALDNADSSLKKASEINKEIDELTYKIRQGIVSKINLSKEKVKKSFNFSF